MILGQVGKDVEANNVNSNKENIANAADDEKVAENGEGTSAATFFL